jgi:hypothetical protein
MSSLLYLKTKYIYAVHIKIPEDWFKHYTNTNTNTNTNITRKYFVHRFTKFGHPKTNVI